MNQILRGLFLTIFIFFFLINIASATDYYVSPEPLGDNNNNGNDLSTPFKTIKHGVEKLHAGDTLFIMDGIYNERVKLSRSGTPSNPITITGYSNGAVLNGQNDKGQAIKISDKEYININNFEITHYSYGIYSTRSNYVNIDNMHIHYMKKAVVSFYEGHDLTLTNCNLHDAAHNMVQIMGKYNDMWNVLIDSNRLHGNPGITHFGTSHAGIDIFNANYDTPEKGHVSGVTITNNKIYDMHLPAIFTHGDDNYYMENMRLECNEIYDTYGVETGHFKDSVIKNNYVHHQSVWGFYTYVDSGDLAMFNMEITGNVVHDCPYLKSNRALSDITWKDNSIPDFMHWKGTLSIVDNRRKTFSIKTKGKIYIEYTDSRDFTVDGKTYTGSCTLDPSGYVVYNIVNPSGSDNSVIPSCITNPSAPPDHSDRSDDQEDPETKHTPDQTDEYTPNPISTSNPTQGPEHPLLWLVGSKKWNGDWDSLHYYMTTKNTTVQVKNAEMGGRINIVGWRNISLIDGKFYIYGNASDCVIEDIYVEEYLSGSKARWNDNVDWIREDVNGIEENGIYTSNLNLTMKWHHSKKRADGPGTKKTYYMSYLLNQINDTAKIPMQYIEQIDIDNITVEVMFYNNSYSPKTVVRVSNKSGICSIDYVYKNKMLHEELIEGRVLSFENGIEYVKFTDNHEWQRSHDNLSHAGDYMYIKGANFSVDNFTVFVNTPYASYELTNYNVTVCGIYNNTRAIHILFFPILIMFIGMLLLIYILLKQITR